MAVLKFKGRVNHKLAYQEVAELKKWLANRTRKLAATNQEAKRLPELLINLWLQRVNPYLYVKTPNFFFNAMEYDEKTYTKFFSPYREG